MYLTWSLDALASTTHKLVLDPCKHNESKWGYAFCLESNSPTQICPRPETHAVPYVATNDKGCWKTTS